MRAAILILSLVSTNAFAGNDYFGPLALSRCHIFTVAQHAYELCSISSPAGEKRRTFTLTVRDPQVPGAEDGPPAAPQQAKHKLIAEQALAPQPGEYLDYDRVSPLDLDENHWVLQLAYVRGTPDDYDEARSVLYIFDGKNARFSKAWESPVCAPKCKGQTLQVRGKLGVVAKPVIVMQNLGGEQKIIELKWDGWKITAGR